MKKTVAIRGAVNIYSNTKAEIEEASLRLMDEILNNNNLKYEDIISVQISSTADITAYYPATALRLGGCTAPLFSCLEPPIENAMPLCIRFLILAGFNNKTKPLNIYLNDTIKLIS